MANFPQAGGCKFLLEDVRDTLGGSPASRPYAMPCGISMMPITMPVMMSRRKLSRMGLATPCEAAPS